jgi:DNA-binding NtrC family response regulator
MAVVLCVGINPDLVATRKMMLEQAGHTVFAAHNLREVEAACAGHEMDVVVVGQRIPGPEKHRLMLVARQCFPKARVLELYEHGGGKLLAEADDWLFVPTDFPGDLVDRVEALAARGPRS